MDYFYIAYFALVNLIIYLRLNRQKVIGKNVFGFFIIIVLIFSGLHFTGISILMGWRYYWPLIFMQMAPVLANFWFRYIVLNKIERLNIAAYGGLKNIKKVFSIFFLHLTYIMVFWVQCSLILDPIK
ncbi:hypothetical protein C8P68_11253 [Mucilaginibacter yixingensis]|uniref:Uncharacterized protein n=1 Tax=Mucilaginibacter yixingensis TaxID=1295612 RepID=A0A2T5J4L6_9SPHI|nr:hypothetical protein C8P68_11253 [Mucilaginibacter yixingensis]